MAESLPVAVQPPQRARRRFLLRTTRRTLLESLYLLTAPLIAAIVLLVTFGGLCLVLIGLLRPHRSQIATTALTPARWSADLERWRITKLRPPTDNTTARPRPNELTPSDPGLWLDVAHAIVMLPITWSPR